MADPEHPGVPPARNWAGNVTFSPARLARPTSVDALRHLVAGAERVRALGTGHSFSPVADTDGVLVSLADMPSNVEVHPGSATATVSGQVRWGELARVVHRYGLAVPNLGSLPHISVAGSVSTGTHGSGSRLGCLATAVRGLELVTAGGDLRTVRRGDPDFAGSVVALGCLGVLTRVELDLVPSYDVEQTVWDGLPLAVAVDRFDAVMDCARSVSLFTTWAGAGLVQAWVKHDTADRGVDLAWSGARRADGPRHPVPGLSPNACTEQGARPGPWLERIPHFRLEFTPSSGRELQSEYLLPRRYAAAALAAVRSVSEVVAPVLQVSEIRTVAADELWLSPCQGRPSVAVHFTWIDDVDAVMPAVAAVESVLQPYDPRPHWGKVFGTAPARVRSAYPHLDAFVRLRRRLDPDGTFANTFTDRYVGR